MKIKEVVNEVGISVHTIRFYEEVGLIKINRFPDSQYRDFRKEDVEKLKEIKLFRSLGITMEEIRRYYHKEITLDDLMNHQLKELESHQEDMKLKKSLCEDIRKGKSPLIPYTVDKYDQIIEHKSNQLPYKEAGSLLAQWGEKRSSKSRRIVISAFIFPFVFLFTNLLVGYIFSIAEMIETGQYSSQWSVSSFVIALIVSTLAVCFCFNAELSFPDELYEFCEHGISYINQDTKKFGRDIRRAKLNGKIEDCYDFIDYKDIKIFKVWYHDIGKTPINGAYVYAVDFRIFTSKDEMIRLDTGVFGTSDEKVRFTAEILKSHAQKVVDPFRILDHLDLNRDDFYKYIDGVHYKRIYKRLGKSS